MSVYGGNDASRDNRHRLGSCFASDRLNHVSVAWTWLFPCFQLAGVQFLAAFGRFALRQEFAGSEQTIAD